MATRTRPSGCCAPSAVKPLPAGRLSKITAVAKALADPNRIEILRLLAAQESAVCACDIVDHLALSQPTVSHHLKVLKEAGLMRGSRKGLWAFYEVEAEGLALLEMLTAGRAK